MEDKRTAEYDEGFEDCRKEILVWLTMVADRAPETAVASRVRTLAQKVASKSWRAELVAFRAQAPQAVEQ